MIPPRPPGGPPVQWGAQRAPDPPTQSLAIVALVCSLLGVTLLPLLGGVVGAGLGALAMRDARSRPGAHDARTLAQIALLLGLIAGVLPLALLLFAFAGRLTVLPGLVVVAYGTAVAVVGLRKSTPGERASARRSVLYIVLAALGVLMGVALVALVLGLALRGCGAGFGRAV